MTSKPVALLMADLGVTKTHSRPHVSDDNPYSESQFKTLKYRPEFPERFGSIEDSRAFGQKFFAWYNREHHHSGIALLTPEMLHYGLAGIVIEQRQQVLDAAYKRNPERFTHARPKHPPQPTASPQRSLGALYPPFLDYISIAVQEAIVAVAVAQIKAHNHLRFDESCFHLRQLSANLLHWLVSFEHP
jgi:hypothetical protein